MKNNLFLTTIIILFFLIRLYNLTILPIFNDEAIYTYWGQEMVNSSKLLFYSLSDAKPPLLMWFFGLSIKLFNDPLVGGRIISIIFGLLTLIGLYKIGQHFLTKKIGLIASILYIITPIFHFYDRQALMESAIGCITVWVLFFLMKYLHKQSLITIIIVGILISLGVWIKTNAILLLPVVMIFFVTNLTLILRFFCHSRENGNLYKYMDPRVPSMRLRTSREDDPTSPRQTWLRSGQVSQSDGNFNKNPLLTFFILLFTIAFSLLPLFLQREFWITLSSNSRYSLTFAELLKIPISHWFNNSYKVIDIIFWQITPVIIFFFFIGLINAKKYKNITKIIIVFLLTLVFLVIILTRSVNPRYIVSFIPPMVILGSIGIDYLLNRKGFVSTSVTLILFIIPFLITLSQSISPLFYFLLLSKISSNSQEWEYVKNWSSGYGIQETLSYLRTKSKKSPILVGVRIDSGNPESAIMSYFFNDPMITPIFIDTKSFSLAGFSCIKSTVPFYFISRDGITDGLKTALVEIKRFNKPVSISYVSIHKVNHSCRGKTIEYYF